MALGPVFLGMSIIYVLAPEGVSAHVLGYRSVAGWFGVTGLLRLAGAWDSVSAYRSALILVLPVALVATGSALARRTDTSARELVLTAALLLALLPGLGLGYAPQYAYWFMPLLVVTYPLYDRGWRRVLAACLVVAVVTYLVEYAILPSHGMLLTHIVESREPFLGWSHRWSSQSRQTLMRLPLFAAYVTLLVAGFQRLRRAALAR